MRLLNFLKEQEEFTGCSKIENFYSKNSGKLYRGMKNAPNEGKIVTIQDRKPKDSTLWFHKNMDKAFIAVFGKPLRSCSVFCTGNAFMTRAYGKTYTIYPSDDFEVYWSPKIVDLYESNPADAKTSHTNEDWAMAAVWALGIEKEAHEDDIKYRLRESGESDYTDEIFTFLEAEFPELYAATSSHDRASDWKDLAAWVLKKYPNCITNFVKSAYQKGNLEAAIKSGNELMITCSYYYYRLA